MHIEWFYAFNDICCSIFKNISNNLFTKCKAYPYKIIKWYLKQSSRFTVSLLIKNSQSQSSQKSVKSDSEFWKFNWSDPRYNLSYNKQINVKLLICMHWRTPEIWWNEYPSQSCARTAWHTQQTVKLSHVLNILHFQNTDGVGIHSYYLSNNHH